MKILFIAQNLYTGGIQTSLINLINKLAENPIYKIELFSFGKGPLAQRLPSNIKVTYGNRLLCLAATPFMEVKKRNPVNIALRIILLVWARIVGSEKFYHSLFKGHKISKKYDTVISYFNDTAAGYLNKGTNWFAKEYVSADKKVAWIHTDPELAGFDKQRCRDIYRGFDNIICVSKAVKDKFDNMLPEYANKTQVVYNIVQTEHIKMLAKAFKPNADKNKFQIVTVGRIDNSTKRIDKIVEICKELKDKGIDNFNWHIVGGGPDLKKNKELSKKLGLENIVIFAGEQLNPYPYIDVSDLFVLCSAYEGYPMVVEEAIALETPVLTLNYAAAGEQISEKNGIVVDSDEKLIGELEKHIKRNKFSKGNLYNYY